MTVSCSMCAGCGRVTDDLYKTPYCHVENPGGWFTPKARPCFYCKGVGTFDVPHRNGIPDPRPSTFPRNEVVGTAPPAWTVLVLGAMMVLTFFVTAWRLQQ